MSRTPPHAPSPATLPVGDALARHDGLVSLLARVQASQARWNAVRTELPAALADGVRPGPLDDTGWTLLVASGAGASKLRQCLPRLEQAWAAQGWGTVKIRIKVLVTPG